MKKCYFKNIIISALSIVILLFSSCGESSTSSDIDKGNYEIKILQYNAEVYKGGGGIYIFKLEPENNFGGKVNLSIDANSAFRPDFPYGNVSISREFTELVIKPDYNLQSGKYILTLYSNHAGVNKNIKFEVSVMDIPNLLPDSFAIKIRNEFLEWFEGKYPYLSLNKYNSWKYSYCKNPHNYGGYEWNFINDNWEVTVKWIVIPNMPKFISVRKRFCELYPTHYAKRDGEGPIREISQKEFEY